MSLPIAAGFCRVRWLRIDVIGRLLLAAFFAATLLDEVSTWHHAHARKLTLKVLLHFSPHGMIEALLLHKFPFARMALLLACWVLLALGVARAPVVAMLAANACMYRQADYM